MTTTWNKQNGQFMRNRSQIANESPDYTRGADAAEKWVNRGGNLWGGGYANEEYDNGYCDTLAEARRYN